MIVGITGGIGSGKSLVANYFCKISDAEYYHADKEAKKLMNSSEEIKNQIIDEFGKEIYRDDQLDRTLLSKLVFTNKSYLQKLNNIVHPKVKKHFSDFVNSNCETKYIIYENAILFESKSYLSCDVIVCVLSPLNIRIQRVMKRDGASKESVLNRINNQWTDNQRTLLSHYRVFNIDKKETYKEIDRINDILTKRKN